jgi:hypothetical protein
MRNMQLLATDKFDSTNFAKNVFKTCYHYKGIFQEGEIKTFPCAVGTKGRFLVLSTPGAFPLSLCEVEVYPENSVSKYRIMKEGRKKLKGERNVFPLCFTRSTIYN